MTKFEERHCIKMGRCKHEEDIEMFFDKACTECVKRGRPMKCENGLCPIKFAKQKILADRKAGILYKY